MGLVEKPRCRSAIDSALQYRYPQSPALWPQSICRCCVAGPTSNIDWIKRCAGWQGHLLASSSFLLLSRTARHFSADRRWLQNNRNPFAIPVIERRWPFAGLMLCNGNRLSSDAHSFRHACSLLRFRKGSVPISIWCLCTAAPSNDSPSCWRKNGAYSYWRTGFGQEAECR